MPWTGNQEWAGGADGIGNGGNGAPATEWYTPVVLATHFPVTSSTFDRHGEVSTTWADAGDGEISISIDQTSGTIHDGVRECATKVGVLENILTDLNLVNPAVTLTRAMIESGQYFLQWTFHPAAGISLSDGALFAAGMCDDNASQTALLALVGGPLYEATGSLNIRASNSDGTTGTGTTTTGSLVANASVLSEQLVGVQGSSEHATSRTTVRDGLTGTMGDAAHKGESWATSAVVQPVLFAGYETSLTTATSDHKWLIQVGVRLNPLFA